MYDKYYGLGEMPFQLGPDPSYYFESATHRQALSYLGYGLAQAEGFVVVTGDSGTGKSTLVSHVLQRIDKTRLMAATMGAEQNDSFDLMQNIAHAFGIDTSDLDRSSLLKNIEKVLHNEARDGRRCLLVVDDAHNLAIDALEELRALSNFQLGSSTLLQIFLVGRTELADVIRDAPGLEQFRQRVIATDHLDPMDASEIGPYIVHRLSRAGWTGRPEISADAFAALHAEVGGIPRKLNVLVNRVMLMGAVEQTDMLDAALVQAVIADMAAPRFDCDAPMSSRAPLSPAPENQPSASLCTADETNTAEIEVEALAARFAQLQKRVTEQDDALRRVLAMMIDWSGKDGSTGALIMRNGRAA